MNLRSAIAGLLATLFTTVFKDELGVLQPMSDDYLTKIATNPAAENVLAQSAAFIPNAMALLPNLEATAAKDGALILKGFLDAQIPNLVALNTAQVTAAIQADAPGVAANANTGATA